MNVFLLGTKTDWFHVPLKPWEIYQVFVEAISENCDIFGEDGK